MVQMLRISKSIAIFMVCLMAAGCGSAPTASVEGPLVRSETIKLNPALSSATYAGEVRGRYETPLGFQVSGKIINRYVELGSRVNPGDVLMEIDAKDIQQNVNITAAQVYSAEAQLKLAENNLNRYEQLYEQGAISRAQLDQYQTAYAAAQAAVRQTNAQNTQSSNQLGYSALIATDSGVVSSINAEAGQVVSAGQPMLTLVRDGEKEVEINVPENRVEELKKAQTLEVNFWALANTVVQGKIREVSPMADKVSRTYKVRITLINPPQDLQLGMTASVKVNVSTNQGTLLIPLSAIYQTGDQPGVWVVNNGIVNLTPIKVGALGNEKVEVLEGLQDGQIIVTAGVHKLREGQTVRLAGDKP